MDFRYESSFTEKAADLLPILQSKALWDARAEKIGLQSYIFTQEGNDENREVFFAAQVENSRLPAPINRFLPRGLEITIKSHCIGAGGTTAGGTTIEYLIDVKGAPVQVELRSEIVDEAAGTRIIHYGNLQVQNPFLGRIAEQKALAAAPRLLEIDKDLITHILEN